MKNIALISEYLGAASYDPADNKLRFRPGSRLSKTDYDRARAVGFIWAPKQELFVAPMWTPEREDLLLEWCGDVGDEDTSLVERALDRAERFEDYSESRADDANQAHAGVAAIADGIPLGQLILVGHHSEKRARKDAERIENGMRKAIKMWDQSQYWQQRAKGAIRHAKYKERPDVRARRIKKLEAEKRGRDRCRAGAEKALRFWNGKFVGVAKDGTKTPLEIIEANRETICRILGSSYEMSFYASTGIDGNSNYSGWDVLKPDGDRYKNCPSLTVAELQSVAFEHYAKIIAGCDRWVAHYENRITYERAMLDESGGTVTDKKGQEKGGACKCWVNRGNWCEIVKVNKVSVSLADNWGNGGPDFLRTIPFDKLTEVISREEWQAMKAGGAVGGRQAGWQQKEHAEAIASKEPDAGAKFDALRDTLKAGVQVVSAPQLFPTPKELAQRVIELADIQAGYRVLEPSCGTGNLLAAIKERFGWREIADCGALEIIAVEINHKLAGIGTRLHASRVICGDFMERNGDLGKFDRIVMNPPFANGSDIKHISHALTFLNPGGRLVSICANGPKQQAALKPQADQWIELEDAFTEAGTNVRTAIAVFDR